MYLLGIDIFSLIYKESYSTKVEYRSWLKLRYEQEKILQLIMSVSDRSKLSPRSQSICTGDGTTLRAYCFKAVVFVVPFCRLLKWFRFLEISNNSCSSLPMDSLAILHRLSSFQSWPLLKTMHFGFLKFRSLCLLSLWQKSPSCWQTESSSSELPTSCMNQVKVAGYSQ